MIWSGLERIEVIVRNPERMVDTDDSDDP